MTHEMGMKCKWTAPHDISDDWIERGEPARDGKVRIPGWGTFSDVEVRLSLAAGISPITLGKYSRKIKQEMGLVR